LRSKEGTKSLVAFRSRKLSNILEEILSTKIKKIKLELIIKFVNTWSGKFGMKDLRSTHSQDKYLEH